MKTVITMRSGVQHVIDSHTAEQVMDALERFGDRGTVFAKLNISPRNRKLFIKVCEVEGVKDGLG